MNYTITQNGLNLEKNFDSFPTQFSENVKVSFIRDPLFTGHIMIPFIAYGRNKQYIATPKMLKDDTLIFPKEVFKESGRIALSFSIANDNEVIYTNITDIRINKSSGKLDILPDEESWITVLSNFLMQELRDRINPAIQTVLKDTQDLQEVVHQLVSETNDRLDTLYDNTQSKTDELIEQLNQKLHNGDFNGLTILNGIGIPSPTLGRDGDTYINTNAEGEYAQYFFIKIDGIWEPQFKVAGKDGTDTLPVGSEVLIDYDQPIPVGYEEVEEVYEATEVYLENGKTVEESISSIDLDGNVQPTLSISTTRDSTKEKVKVQLTDSSGKAIMIETSADQVYVNDDTKLSDVLNGQAFYIKQEDGLLYLGNYTEWIDAGKPSMLQGE